MGQNPWVDTRPFALGPAEAPLGCVLVHGFTGAPSEMRPVGELLAARGHRAVGVLLPGHGTEPDDLHGVRWHEWLEAVSDGVRWVRETCDRVAVVGLSMGGLLTSVYATEAGSDLAAAVLLAPAFRMRNPLVGLASIGRFFVDSLPAPDLPNDGLTSPDGWKKLWHYDRRPLDAAWELWKLRQVAWKRLASLDTPTLIVQGRKDQTLYPEGAQEAFDRIPAHRKKLVWLSESGHCLTVDVDFELAAEAITHFLAPAHSHAPVEPL